MTNYLRSIGVILLVIAGTYTASEWAVKQKPVRPATVEQVEQHLAVVKAELVRQERLIEEARRP
jgi:hypothetical protein